MKKLTVRVPDDVHERLVLCCAGEGCSLAEVVRGLLQPAVRRLPLPPGEETGKIAIATTRAAGKIQAIKTVKRLTGMQLLGAKEYVDKQIRFRKEDEIKQLLHETVQALLDGVEDPQRLLPDLSKEEVRYLVDAVAEQRSWLLERAEWQQRHRDLLDRSARRNAAVEQPTTHQRT